MRVRRHVVRKPSGTDHAVADVALTRSRDEMAAAGRALRAGVPRQSHAGWRAPHGRRDPITVLLEATHGLVPALVPIRFGRMLQSPFTFYRGAAVVMAADLARTPATGVRVQACGDCHLVNFGGFATPERRLIFDINDFDETLPAPWEWDVKRLAASFAVAARDKRFAKRDVREAATMAVRTYRTWMAEFAAMPVLEAWYAALDLRHLVERTGDRELLPLRRKRLRRALREPSAEVDYPKLIAEDRRPRIRDNPPLIYHAARGEGVAHRKTMLDVLERYRDSLPEERRILFDRYQFVDAAVKVVGIGSVGTVCGIVLLLAGGDDPLVLQVKEARASVLEPWAGASLHENHGQRVVVGQRIVQAASDAFLGWTMGEGGRHFYVRQLRDAKVKPMLEVFDAEALIEYARACGHALARAHARSGRAAVIAGYMGKSSAFDDAVAAFALDYADQTERERASRVAAVRAGRIEAVVPP